MLTMLLDDDGHQPPRSLSFAQRSISRDSSSTMLTVSSNGSKNSTASNAAQLNQYLGGDVVMSASVRRWHQVAATYAPTVIRRLQVVMCSLPGKLSQGSYVIRLVRASLKQEFGLAFDIAETRDGRLEAIVVSQDLPHLGFKKSDRLQSINGLVPSNLLQCRTLLQEAYSIVLVMQPWNPKASELQSTIKKHTVMAAVRAVDQPLIWLSHAVVTDPRRGEFKIGLHRSSSAMPFSMPNWSQKTEAPLAEDFPHLAVLAGDRLVSVNGVRTFRRKLCQKLLATAMSVDLVFRRDPNTQAPPKHRLHSLDAMGAAVVRNQPSHKPFSQQKSSTLSLSSGPAKSRSAPEASFRHTREKMT